MKLILSPIRHDTPLVLERRGDVLSVNGTALDFGPLPEGATLPRDAIDCPWIAGDVTRQNGVLHIPLLLPHGAEAGTAARYPAPLELGRDGPVALPGAAAASAPPEETA